LSIGYETCVVKVAPPCAKEQRAAGCHVALAGMASDRFPSVSAADAAPYQDAEKPHPCVFQPYHVRYTPGRGIRKSITDV